MKKIFKKKELSEEEIAKRKERKAKNLGTIVKVAEGVVIGICFVIGGALILAAKSIDTESSDFSSSSDSSDIPASSDSYTDSSSDSEA